MGKPGTGLVGQGRSLTLSSPPNRERRNQIAGGDLIGWAEENQRKLRGERAIRRPREAVEHRVVG
jgi:hypothetical protein